MVAQYWIEGVRATSRGSTRASASGHLSFLICQRRTATPGPYCLTPPIAHLIGRVMLAGARVSPCHDLDEIAIRIRLLQHGDRFAEIRLNEAVARRHDDRDFPPGKSIDENTCVAIRQVKIDDRCNRMTPSKAQSDPELRSWLL